MNVCGFTRTTLVPTTTPNASLALAFFCSLTRSVFSPNPPHTSPSAFASRSTTSNPTLCLVSANFDPGFPKPTISHRALSSVPPPPPFSKSVPPPPPRPISFFTNRMGNPTSKRTTASGPIGGPARERI